MLEIKELGVSEQNGELAEYVLTALSCALEKMCPTMDTSSCSANPFKKIPELNVSRALNNDESF